MCGLPQNLCFVMENPLKIDDFRGYHLFYETLMYKWPKLQHFFRGQSLFGTTGHDDAREGPLQHDLLGFVQHGN